MVNEQITLKFSVIDSGIGITEAQMAKLFNSFSQADTSTTRKYGDTDLGLTICRKLVTLMDGEINVESEPDKGSQFHFDVKLKLADSQTRIAKVAESDLGELNVLIVDDNSTAQEILKHILHSFNFSVTVCPSGL